MFDDTEISVMGIKNKKVASPLAITDIRPLTDDEKIRILKNAVIDSIIIIEETKRSFKSRRLETLRRELMRILSETS